MRILSNGFPTNLPDSEKVSQGGPANFARLFVAHIVANTAHEWIGVMLEGVSSETTRLEKVFSAKQRSYYRLRTPRKLLRKVVQASSMRVDPVHEWDTPIRRLVKLIQEQKPDVVFLNGFGIFNWMLLKAAEKAGVPVVIQHAGIWTKELSIHKDLYTTAGRKLMEAMERESTAISSVEIFLNEWSKSYYEKNVVRGRNARATIVPLPFDFESFLQLSVAAGPSQFAFTKEVKHVGVIARWDEIKNHPAVLSMAKAAKKAGLPLQFHSIVEIPPHPKYAKEKEAYERYVDVIPPVDRAGISDFCRSVDMLLLPSLFDVSPTVVLEAIASKTPIFISPTIGYVSDFIRYGAKPWIVDHSNTPQTVARMIRLADEPMPPSLVNHLLTNHDHRSVFATYLDIFKRVTDQSTKSRGVARSVVLPSVAVHARV